MAKPKKAVVKQKKGKQNNPMKETRKVKADHRVDYTYEQNVTFICPKRGRVTQKVMIKRFKTLGEMAAKQILAPDAAIDKLENTDDGLGIYGDDVEVTDEVTE